MLENYIVLLLVFMVSVLTSTQIFKWYKNQRRTSQIINEIPGQPAYPLIGTTWEYFGVSRKDIFKVIDNEAKLYPYISRSWMGPIYEVTIRKAEYIERVISSSKHLEKSFIYNFVRRWLGDGLLLSSGNKWHKHRKIITPTFHFSILEGFCDIFSEKSNILVEKLTKHCGSGVPINIQTFITNATLDIICDAAMAIQVNSQNESKNEYVESIYEISELILHRILRPWLFPDFIYKRSSAGKQFQRCLDILHGYTLNVIKNRKLTRKSKGTTESMEGKKRLAFLDLLLEANEDKNLLSDNDIREEVDTFMFEGHDTTSSGISWTLFLLGLHPDVQQKVLDELESIYSGSDRPTTIQDLNEMKYLERVIKETIRLFPPVPLIGRILSEDVEFDQYKVPKGTPITIQIYQLHRDERFFKDADKFDPDRFLPENTVGRHPYAYIPFSAGPRNCIGQKFAMYEEKTMISTIIRKFKLKTVDKMDDINLVSELILRPFEGVNVLLEKRNK